MPAGLKQKTEPEKNNIDPKRILYFISHSGGKDSQAMYSYLLERLPFNQIVLIHADLGRIEWKGVQDHIRNTVQHPLNVVRANKTFIDMVRQRAHSRPDVPSWPSRSIRQCTSDLKRNPIEKFIRHYMKTHGYLHAINIMGLRAEESPERAKRPKITLNNRLSRAGRTIYNWLPIHDWTESQVFTKIAKAGQKPFWTYLAGNKRLSCVFCIMGCNSDLINGKKYRPELYQEYINLEEETGWTMFPNMSLEEKTKAPPQQHQPMPKSTKINTKINTKITPSQITLNLIKTY